MQEFVLSQTQVQEIEEGLLPLDDYQKLVNAFAWLIAEDKRQNPEYYQQKKEDKND